MMSPRVSWTTNTEVLLDEPSKLPHALATCISQPLQTAITALPMTFNEDSPLAVLIPRAATDCNNCLLDSVSGLLLDASHYGPCQKVSSAYRLTSINGRSTRSNELICLIAYTEIFSSRYLKFIIHTVLASSSFSPDQTVEDLLNLGSSVCKARSPKLP